MFELGHTYLQLVQTLNLRLPLVDPSHYISRFSALLEFGDETNKVATDAVRLVQRFDRDWMTRGRRPAGICGAALLLAARMNNFRRSVEEIVQVVKIADTTLKKRLEEFKNSPSGALTLADFRSVWLEEEMDPPSFTKGKEKAEKERLVADQAEDEQWDPSKHKKTKAGEQKKKKRKRKRKGHSSSPSSDSDSESEREQTPLDPAVFNQGILADNANGDEDDNSNINIDPALLASTSILVPLPPPPPSSVPSLSSVITDYLSTSQGVQIASEIEDQRRVVDPPEVVDELLGLDEAELDAFLLSEDEVKIKERVWVELNRDYLEALAAKAHDPAGESKRSRKVPLPLGLPTSILKTL